MRIYFRSHTVVSHNVSNEVLRVKYYVRNKILKKIIITINLRVRCYEIRIVYYDTGGCVLVHHTPGAVYTPGASLQNIILRC